MSIICISKTSYSTGKDIVETVAEKLGYECLGNEVLSETAETFGVSEEDLLKALHMYRFNLKMSKNRQRRLITYILSVLMDHLIKDNIVYHGPGGQTLIQGVSHVLKVFLISRLQDRVKRLTDSKGIANDTARRTLLKEDKERQKWTRKIHGRDDTNPSDFDLVINVSQIDADETIRIITNTAGYRSFQPMTYSINCAKNIHLASKIMVKIIDIDAHVKIRCQGDIAYVLTKPGRKEKEKRVLTIREMVMRFPEIKNVEVYLSEKDFGKHPGGFEIH